MVSHLNRFNQGGGAPQMVQEDAPEPVRWHGAKVVVIDDDPTQRFLAQVELEQAGFRIEEAASGQAGFDLVLKCRPALVILDILMPVRDGISICADIRAHEETRTIPVVLITGLTDAATMQRGFAAGATGFLVKPIDWQSLAGKLVLVLDAVRQPGADLKRLQLLL